MSCKNKVSKTSPVKYLSNTFERPLFVGIREVQERVSERIVKVPGRYVDGTVKASRVAEKGRQRSEIV